MEKDEIIFRQSETTIRTPLMQHTIPSAEIHAAPKKPVGKRTPSKKLQARHLDLSPAEETYVSTGNPMKTLLQTVVNMLKLN
jgi:hypothetical protein